MQTLYIIGNGFDLNLGMKTSYYDFYKYYVTIDSKNELIQKLKDELNGNYESWADLEIAFGNFTEHIKTIEEFDDVFDDLSENLSAYLKLEQNAFNHSLVKKELFFKYLHSPEESLPQADINELKHYKAKWVSHQWLFSIITFNYTYTIENIIDAPIKEIPIGSNANVSSLLKSVRHIHGFFDERMVVGVNDESQIRNKELLKYRDISDALIKPYANKSAKHTIEDACTKLVNEADLICIFGSSIGDTDKNWWKLIGERIKHGIKVIIFTKGEELSGRIPHKRARRERSERERFLAKTALSESEKEEFGENIFIGINTNMFSIM